ncbi:transcription factor RfeG [Ilyonectria robusta]
MAYPSYSTPPSTNPLRQEFSIPRDDIDYDVTEVHRDRQLDPFGRSIKIYKITAYSSLTNEHIDRLKADSARWKPEKRRKAVRPSQSRSHTHRPNRTRHTVADPEDMYVGVDEAPDEITHSYGSRPDEDTDAFYSEPSSSAGHDSSNNCFLSTSQSGKNHETYRGHEAEAENEAGDNYQVYPDVTPDYGHANSTRPVDSTLHGYQHIHGSSAPPSNPNILGYPYGYANSTQPADPNTHGHQDYYSSSAPPTNQNIPGYPYGYVNSTQITDPNTHEYQYYYANAIQPTSANPQAYQPSYYQAEEISTDQVSNDLPSIQDENAFYTVANRPIEAEQDDEDYRRRLARNRRRLNHNQDRFNRPAYA